MVDCGRTSATSRLSTMPSPPSTRPSDARERRSSAFIREVVSDYLRPHEVGPVLAAMSPRIRRMMATTPFLGLRKGELRTLRKADIDLATAQAFVRPSGERSTTKGGHADVVPIHPALCPQLPQLLPKRGVRDLNP